MRAKKMWPRSGARRLVVQMAARADQSSPPPDEPLSRDAIAVALLSRRDRLIRQLPRQIRLARQLNAEQHERVIDEAVDYLVTGNEGGVVKDSDALERAFWAVADRRVRHVIDR